MRTYPNGGGFAFSILDDTDDSTVENVRPVYALLHDLGFKTTKTVWPMDCPEGSRLYFAGQTLQHRPYLDFVHELVGRGFELAWHGATMESSARERTLRGLDFMKREFGALPKVCCNHGQNRENIYWGDRRYQSRVLRAVARMGRPADPPRFDGEVEDSPYFWGDACLRHFRFVRNFAFAEIDMMRCNPEMPYSLQQTPYVKYWFSTSDAPDVEAFDHLIRPERLERLRRENGVCIVSTHLGKGFARDGRPDPRVRRTLEHLSRSGGWLAPVSEILEHLLAQDSRPEMSPLRRWRLEIRHLVDRFKERRRPWN